MKNQLFESSVWENAWKNDADTSIQRMKKAGIDPTRSFDRKAATFNAETFSEEGRRRARRIMNWLEDQGVAFNGKSILDVGAATGGFTVPFAERGARVTSVETSPPQIELLKENVSGIPNGSVDIVSLPFEDIDIPEKGWQKQFDLVFVSMCPVLTDWESVERILSCSREFCYMSLPVGSQEHSLVDAVWPLVSNRPREQKHMEMAYLLNLLLFKGYAYQSVISRETKTKVLSIADAVEETVNFLKMKGVADDERTRSLVADYVEKSAESGNVAISQGGRFGKVLVRLKNEQMYSRDN